MQTAFDAFVGYLMLDTLIGNSWARIAQVPCRC
jgi:hypothetical protein